MSKLTKQKEITCNTCGSCIGYGSEGIKVEHFICGPRGLIQLGQAFVYCSDECHGRYFENGKEDFSFGSKERIP